MPMTITTERPATAWITPDGAAARAQVSAMTIYREIRRGRLKAFKIADGRLLRIRVQDLDAWMTAGGPSNE